MGKIKKILGTQYKKLIPLVHFLITFLWENTIFIHENNREYFITAAREGNVISDKCETIIVYVLSRIVSFIIIWLLWKLIFYILDKKVSKKDFIVLGIVLLIGLIIGIILYPSTFAIEIDNYTNYFNATRFQPTYWQSIYTGVLYAGCLMVIPHPISLFIFQWLFFWFVVSYIYIGIEKIGLPQFKYYALLLLAVPESYYLVFNAYRNNYYTVLVMFYIAYIFFSIKKPIAELKIADIIKFALISAFIANWRSEGIVICIAGVLVYLIYIIKLNRINWKKTSIFVVGVVVFWCTLHQIQAIGSQKYYGQDYMILNTASVLCSIFNDPDSNLTYGGSDEDLENIEAIIPVEVLKEYGIRGYRDYNWTQGHADFNQTLASDEQAAAYMKSYYRLILHNVNDYLGVQLNCFYTALGIQATKTTYSYAGDSNVELESFVYDTWRYGKKEVMSTRGTKAWLNNTRVSTLRSIMSMLLEGWRDIIINSGLAAIIRISSIAGVVILMFKNIIVFIEGHIEKFGFAIGFITILAELLAVLLFMPEGRAAYLYPIIYAGYLLIFLYVMNAKMKDEDITNE